MGSDYAPGGARYQYPDWIQSVIRTDQPVPVRELAREAANAVARNAGQDPIAGDRPPGQYAPVLPGEAGGLAYVVNVGGQEHTDALVSYRPDGPLSTGGRHRLDTPAAVEVILDTQIRRSPADIEELHRAAMDDIGRWLDPRTGWRWRLDLTYPMEFNGRDVRPGGDPPIGWPASEPWPPRRWEP